MANRQASSGANGEMDDHDGEAGSQPLVDGYDVYGIQPGQHERLSEGRVSNSQPEATSTISRMVSSLDSCGRAQLTLYTYPELHQFVLEMVKIFEDVYSIRD